MPASLREKERYWGSEMKVWSSVLNRRFSFLVLICILISICALILNCERHRYLKEQLRISIYLDATSDWHNTGLCVNKGDTLRFECRGSWAVASEKESQRWPDTGPEGHGKHPGERIHRLGDSKKELLGVPFGTLLGRVGEIVFPIGDRKDVVMPSNGFLYLVINDYPFCRHDNRGRLTIMIQKLENGNH